MAIDTKPNLSSSKFEQCSGDILNLSGCTQVFGTFDVHPSGSIDSCSGYKISGSTFLNTGTGGITSLIVGCNVCASTLGSIAIGGLSKATGTTATAIGYCSRSINTCSVALGAFAYASGIASQSIGSCSCACGNSLAVGYLTKATGATSIAIGWTTCATANCALAIGNTIKTCGAYGIAIGNNACAYGTSAIAFGTGSKATGNTSIAIGCNVYATGLNSIALGGLTSCAINTCAIAIGNTSISSGVDSITIGDNSCSVANNSIAIGRANINCGAGSNIIGGYGNLICNTNTGSTIIGGINTSLSSAGYSNFAVVPNLAIWSTPSGTGSYLCWDSGTKKVGLGAGGSSSAGSAESILKQVTQNSHGFVVGNVVGWSGGTYNKAIGKSSYDGEVIGLVSKCVSANIFEVTQAGYVTGLTGLVTNTTYFLSPVTAGAITVNQPSGNTQIVKSVLVATSTTAAWVLPYPGYVVTTGTTSSSLTTFTITGNGSTTGFTVTHNKNNQFINVQIVKNVSPYPTIYTSVERTNANCVCITFDIPPVNGVGYKVMVTG
jgi:trimeric autotransporter adhesin